VPAAGALGLQQQQSQQQLGSGGSAVDLLESLLRQGKAAGAAQQQPTAADADAEAAGAGAGGSGSNSVARCASLPSWVPRGVAPSQQQPRQQQPREQVGASVNLRGSMLACESTFIFPSGLAQPQPQLEGGQGLADTASAGDFDATGTELACASEWHHQQQLGGRRVASAPGNGCYNSSSACVCGGDKLARAHRVSGTAS
jgi:hypothetical protein